jgi:uncharacterized protein (TIGR02217 family)
MAFYAIEIDACAAFGFAGGPEFQTNIQPIANGSESRNADWAVCRHKYTEPFQNIDEDAYAAIKTVFLLCRGRNHTFLFKDPGDFEATDEQFGTGDGTTTVFQLKKTSTLSGTSATYERTVYKPVSGIKVYVDDVLAGAAVDTTTGKVTFSSAPDNGAVLTWTGEFRVHVRFDIDYLPFSLQTAFADGTYARNGSVDLIEVLNETENAS